MARPFSEAAYRCSEIIRGHIADGDAGKWVAIRLSDGGSDGRAYSCSGMLCPGYPHCAGRTDAVRAQLHETLCMYIKVPLDNMPAKDAERMLRISRQVYDAGFRLVDPEQPEREVIIPERR